MHCSQRIQLDEFKPCPREVGIQVRKGRFKKFSKRFITFKLGFAIPWKCNIVCANVGGLVFFMMFRIPKSKV